MSTDFPIEVDAFKAFLDQRFVTPDREATLEEALAAFRGYQRDRDRLKEKLRPSIEQADRGEGSPLDLDDVLDRVRRRLDEQGIR